MSILERLERDMVAATKARERERLGAIRFIRSELKNRQIELGRELKDDDAIDVLSRITKRHRESIEQFEAGGRPDLVERERQQMAVAESYLPEQLGEGELSELVGDVIAEVGATEPGDLGRVMKAIMPRVKGRAPGGAVRALVQERLSETEAEG